MSRFVEKVAIVAAIVALAVVGIVGTGFVLAEDVGIIHTTTQTDLQTGNQ